MAVSARNQLTGTVSAVAAGAVNDEVELTLAGGAKLVAIVTHAGEERCVRETLERLAGSDSLLDTPMVMHILD